MIPKVLGGSSCVRTARILKRSAVWVLPVACFAQGVAPTFSSAGVVNASGYQKKLAPDTVFVIFGSSLGPAALVSTASPYPVSLGGTSITFTPLTGGTPIPAKMVYSGAGQVAGLLPSSAAPGTYAVRVTYNGQTSLPQNVTVVAHSFGIATANNGGSGTAQATIGNVNGGLSLTRFAAGSLSFGGFDWTLTPAHPGDSVVFWGTGGGADPTNDTGGTSGDQTAAGGFVVNVGGRQITPLYAGASFGYPGLWQINFTLPQDIAPDCFASAQVTAGGELSNTVILPIAAPGQSACSDPQLSPAALSKLDSGGNLIAGAFGVARLTDTPSGTVQDTASGFFARYTAAEWLIKIAGPKFGPCQVYDRTYVRTSGKDPGTPDSFLDAGPRLLLNGPNLPAGFGLGVLAAGPIYGNIPAGGTFQAGKYTLTGAGGSVIGPFTAAASFPSTFTVTNFDSVTSIDRTKPLTYNWTGTGFDQVYIQVSTSTIEGSNLHLATIACYVSASLGTYSVPAAALAYLQSSGSGTTSVGSASVQGVSNPVSTFDAPLVGGGQTDLGLFSANLGVSRTIPVR